MPHLGFGSYQLSHRHVHFSDLLIVAITVTVDHGKLKVLRLLKMVVDCEGFGEVWVEGAVDLLGSAQHDPFTILRLEEDAGGV